MTSLNMMRLINVSFALALPFALCALAKGADSNSVSDVTLVVGTAGPRFKASWDFLGIKTSYRVQFASFDGAAPIVEAVAAGAVDIGLPGDIAVIAAQSAGVPIDIVGVERGNPTFLRLIVPDTSTAHRLSDLKGKTIAVARGTAAQMFILQTIREAGLKLDDFRWAYLSNSDAGPAFANRQIDAWATWDPFAATAELKWGARLIVSATPHTAGNAYWIARHGFFSGNSDKSRAARDFIAQCVRANRNEIENRDAWSVALAKALGIDERIAAQVADHYYFISLPLTPADQDSYLKTAALLREQGFIQDLPDPHRFFDFDSVNPGVKAAIDER